MDSISLLSNNAIPHPNCVSVGPCVREEVEKRTRDGGVAEHGEGVQAEDTWDAWFGICSAWVAPGELEPGCADAVEPGDASIVAHAQNPVGPSTSIEDVRRLSWLAGSSCADSALGMVPVQIA